MKVCFCGMEIFEDLLSVVLGRGIILENIFKTSVIYF